MKLLLNFFISGILFGWSLCVLSCGILIFPVIGGISLNWKQGLKNGLLFGLGKTISLSILGAIISYSHFLFQNFFQSKISTTVIGSLFIIYGFWFYFSPLQKKCFRRFNFSFSPFLLGLLYGFIPCGPNIGFLIYLSYVTKGILFGFISGAIFSIGTLTGPILIFSIFSPYLFNKINIFTKNKIYGKILGLGVFFLWGTNLIVKGLLK